MKARGRLACACGLVLMFGPMPSPSESCAGDEDAIARVRREVMQALAWSPQTLFVTERDDLGGDLVDLQYLCKTSGLGPREPSIPLSVVSVRVFELARQGHRVEDGKLLDAAVDLDDAPLWRVAYDCSTKSVFHLYGFADSTQGFNALVKSLHLNFNSADLALGLQSSFVKLVYRSGIDETIRDRLGLMKAALVNYRGRENEDAFLASWRKCPTDVKRRIAPPAAVPSQGGFAVVFFASAEDAVQRVSMLIEPDGSVRSLESRAVYHWPTPKVPSAP